MQAARIALQDDNPRTDVVVMATIENAGPQKQHIQAKCYGLETTVGSPKVQQYASLRLQHDGTRAVRPP